jgi:hypothetical protein
MITPGLISISCYISTTQMSPLETGKRPSVQAMTIANRAQVLPGSAHALVGLPAEKDGEKQEETATTKTVGSCAASGEDRIPYRSSRHAH